MTSCERSGADSLDSHALRWLSRHPSVQGVHWRAPATLPPPPPRVHTNEVSPKARLKHQQWEQERELSACRVSRHKPKGFLDKLATFLENLRRYRCQMSLVGGMYIFKFEPTNTSVASYAGLMLGSESRPPREKICSTLPSCGKWLAVCLNTR